VGSAGGRTRGLQRPGQHSSQMQSRPGTSEAATSF
jgi:hypothetical protein